MFSEVSERTEIPGIARNSQAEAGVTYPGTGGTTRVGAVVPRVSTESNAVNFRG
jgi:hypothetical protein